MPKRLPSCGGDLAVMPAMPINVLGSPSFFSGLSFFGTMLPRSWFRFFCNFVTAPREETDR